MRCVSSLPNVFLRPFSLLVSLSLCNAWVHHLSCVFLLAKISRRLFFFGLVSFLFSSILVKEKMNKTNSTEIDQQRENEWRGGGRNIIFWRYYNIIPARHAETRTNYFFISSPYFGVFFFLSVLSFFFFCVCVYVVFPFCCCCCCVIPGLYRSRTYNWPVTLGHDPLHRIVVCLEPDRLNYIFSLSLSLYCCCCCSLYYNKNIFIIS